MYGVIRIVGEPGIPEKSKDVLRMLNLDEKFSCVLVPEDSDHEGMLKNVKDHITWGELNKDIEDKLSDLMDEGSDNVNLTPPSGGFRNSTKENYPKGESGYRGEQINELLERMI